MTPLHAQRLDAIRSEVLARNATCVLDLGCGDGDLLVRLAEEPSIRKIIGVDLSSDALRRIPPRLRTLGGGAADKVELVHGSILELVRPAGGVDTVVVPESIEHIEPDRLSELDHVVFRRLRPRLAVITTPNADYNELLGVPATRFRHPDHKLEWGRKKFRSWAVRTAGRNDYDVSVSDIGSTHATFGSASQMAVFTRSGESS